ncbi:MAG: hypothetical protein K5838_00540 [Elusimicrobiales bacterium]|nr:hypothetical protein [Elusimicrobiales bacterium]
MTTKRRNILTLISAILFTATAAFASEEIDIGTDAGAFMKIPIGAPRAQALGNTGVSNTEGAESLFINPAGIAASHMREISFSHMSWFQDYSGNNLAYLHPFQTNKWVFGANVSYSSIDNFDNRDSEGVPMNDDIIVKHGYITLSLAREFFMERLLVGGSVKGVLEDNYVKEYKNVVFDAGAILRIGRRLSLGLSSLNMSGGKEIVQLQRAGASLRFNSYITVNVEHKSYSDRDSIIASGVEVSLPEELLQVGKVSLRAGYSPSDDLGKNRDDKTLDTLGMQEMAGWSFGLGLYSAQALGYGVGLDYTFVPSGALGKISQVAVRFQF